MAIKIDKLTQKATKIQAIYQEYQNQLKTLMHKRQKIINAFAKKMEQKKIDEIKKSINL